MRIHRGMVGTAALLLAFTLSACGGSETPGPSAPPSSSQTQEQVQQLADLSNLNGELNIVRQEIRTDSDTGEEVVRVTFRIALPVVGEQEFGISQYTSNGEWTEDSVVLMREIILRLSGYSTKLPGTDNSAVHIAADGLTACEGGPWFGGGADCYWSTSFDPNNSDWAKSDESLRCMVSFKFEDHFGPDEEFWVVSGEPAPVNGPDEEWIMTDHRDTYGSNPTRDDLYEYSHAGLPCGGVSVGS
ncbi:hypothetical protein EG850_12300 [Gulosibacter macacae]|uniref:Lipoprotein n=1 Tax=Gulosibacter macacae TaxID=2488791 RepID=A0A3P3VTQ8_9MICO|nr:hypothetical protein [Gulosibacter macacae]RRJ85697.1 hypothetical protein EG850_12300 [Gulosibacter macacae]